MILLKLMNSNPVIPVSFHQQRMKKKQYFRLMELLLMK